MASKYDGLARIIVQNVGGKDNIVSLPPFIITCVVSAIGGGVLGALNTVQYTMGALGIFSWPTFVNTTTNDAHGMIVAIVVSLACTVAAFIGVLLTYSDET